MRRTAIAVMVIAATVAIPAGSAMAESTGCADLNAPGFDGVQSNFQSYAGEFEDGETLVIEASEPSTGSPITIALFLGSPASLETVVDYPDPARIEYVFPATGSFSLLWDTDEEATVTWQIECLEAPPAPSTTTTTAPGDTTTTAPGDTTTSTAPGDTTTTAPGDTTTTAPGDTTTTAEVDAVTDETLPFTGPIGGGPVAGVALAAVALGALLAIAARTSRREGS